MRASIHHPVRLSPLALLLAGCMIGPSAGSFRVARAPAGAIVKLELTSARFLTGELLASENDGLTLVRVDNTQHRLVMVAHGAITRVEVAQSRGARTIGPEEVARLRLVSRYPQGISMDLQRRLLEAYGQEQLDRIQP